MDFRQAIASALATPAGLPLKGAPLGSKPRPRRRWAILRSVSNSQRRCRKAPPVIAGELTLPLTLPEGVVKAIAAGGYVNFYLDKKRAGKGGSFPRVCRGARLAAPISGEAQRLLSTILPSTSQSRFTSGICPQP